MSGKILKQNAVQSQNAKLKWREFSTLQKRKIKMQRKISVLQYILGVYWEPIFLVPMTTPYEVKAGMMSLQCNNFVIHTWVVSASEASFSQWGAIQIQLTFPFLPLDVSLVTKISCCWLSEMCVIWCGCLCRAVSTMNWDWYHSATSVRPSSVSSTSSTRRGMLPRPLSSDRRLRNDLLCVEWDVKLY